MPTHSALLPGNCAPSGVATAVNMDGLKIKGGHQMSEEGPLMIGVAPSHENGAEICEFPASGTDAFGVALLGSWTV